MTHPATLVDVVADSTDAAALTHLPLVVVGPLQAFLDREDLGTGPLGVERIGGGHSNATFRLRREGFDAVLRRPPRPPYPAGAHDVLREARVQTGLAGLAPVPRIMATCADERVIGAPFYLMEHLDGDVVTTALPQHLDTAPVRARMTDTMVDALVSLHAVPPARAGLHPGRHAGVPERRMESFDRQWSVNAVRAVPEISATRQWLAAHLPPAPSPVVTHGDYRLGNLMFGRDGALTAILDWEIATVDDPLADLGYLLSTHPEPGDPPTPLFALGSVLTDGFCDRRALAERYAAATGRSLEHLRWYVAYAFWKVAIGLESIYRRSLAGTTTDPFARHLEHGVPQLAARALETTRGAFV
jgi:aminoglycoside phosphotransferase (APT) family kinase protein